MAPKIELDPTASHRFQPTEYQDPSNSDATPPAGPAGTTVGLDRGMPHFFPSFPSDRERRYARESP